MMDTKVRLIEMITAASNAAGHALIGQGSREAAASVRANMMELLHAHFDAHAALLARVAELEAEDLALHRKLAAETLRADQGWQRYESANADRNALRAEKVELEARTVANRADLEAIDRAMQHMGDVLNEMDVVENDDEDIATPGFQAIARLLAATPAAPPQPVLETAAKVGPISEQVAAMAIEGAIAYGRLGTNKPPTDDHWLMQYWQIGQQLAELGKTSAWDNVTPVDATPTAQPVLAAVGPGIDTDDIVSVIMADERKVKIIFQSKAARDKFLGQMHALMFATPPASHITGASHE